MSLSEMCIKIAYLEVSLGPHLRLGSELWSKILYGTGRIEIIFRS